MSTIYYANTLLGRGKTMPPTKRPSRPREKGYHETTRSRATKPPGTSHAMPRTHCEKHTHPSTAASQPLPASACIKGHGLYSGQSIRADGPAGLLADGPPLQRNHRDYPRHQEADGAHSDGVKEHGIQVVVNHALHAVAALPDSSDSTSS